MIFMNYDSSTSCWKPWRWVRLDLVFTMRDIHQFQSEPTLTEFTSSSINTKFKDILPWNISQVITKTAPISKRIVINYAMKRDIPFEFDQKSMETKTTTWSEFSSGGKAIVKQKLTEEINKSKTTRTVTATVRDQSRKVNHMSKVIWDRKILFR